MSIFRKIDFVYRFEANTWIVRLFGEEDKFAWEEARNKKFRRTRTSWHDDEKLQTSLLERVR